MHIDIFPGHGKNKAGGYDPGACAFGKEEYQLARMIAIVAANTLKEKYDCTVTTLNLNQDVYLQDRINRYLKKGSTDLIVEVHMNAFSKPTAFGTEVWHYPGDATGQKYASAIATSISNALGTVLRSPGTKGAKATNKNQFGIVDRTAPTAVLVETAFISNQDDMNKVVRDNGTAAGLAIAEAIAKTAGLKAKATPAPTPAPAPAPTVDYNKIIAEKDATIASLTAKINAAVNALK